MDKAGEKAAQLLLDQALARLLVRGKKVEISSAVRERVIALLEPTDQIIVIPGRTQIQEYLYDISVLGVELQNCGDQLRKYEVDLIASALLSPRIIKEVRVVSMFKTPPADLERLEPTEVAVVLVNSPGLLIDYRSIGLGVTVHDASEGGDGELVVRWSHKEGKTHSPRLSAVWNNHSIHGDCFHLFGKRIIL